MTVEPCPVCGAATTYARGTAFEGSDSNLTGELVGWHVDASGESCWVAGYSVSYARAVGGIREREPDLVIRAHP